MYLTQYYLNRILGEQLIVSIDPATIHYYVDSKRPVTKRIENRLIRRPVPFNQQIISLLHRIHPFVIPNRLFPRPTHISNHKTYQKTRDIIEKRHDLQHIQWYQQLMKDLHISGVARYRNFKMHSENEIITFFNEHVFDLVDSMEAEGYLKDKCSDIGTALIGADGELIKSGSGQHRFYVARHLGFKQFPIKIAGVHRNYYIQYKKTNRCKEFISCLTGLISDVERKHS